jgi:hypothetical protein
MTLKKKPRNQFSKKRFISLVKKRFKKKFGKPISTKDINEIVGNWLEYGVIQEVLDGNEVKLGKHASIQVVGEPILESKSLELLKKGLYVTRDGKLKKADNINRKRGNVKYGIEYKNSLAGDKKIYFKPAQSFSRRVHKALIETDTYYKICKK